MGYVFQNFSAEASIDVPDSLTLRGAKNIEKEVVRRETVSVVERAMMTTATFVITAKRANCKHYNCY